MLRQEPREKLSITGCGSIFCYLPSKREAKEPPSACLACINTFADSKAKAVYFLKFLLLFNNHLKNILAPIINSYIKVARPVFEANLPAFPRVLQPRNGCKRVFHKDRESVPAAIVPCKKSCPPSGKPFLPKQIFWRLSVIFDLAQAKASYYALNTNSKPAAKNTAIVAAATMATQKIIFFTFIVIFKL